MAKIKNESGQQQVVTLGAVTEYVKPDAEVEIPDDHPAFEQLKTTFGGANAGNPTLAIPNPDNTADIDGVASGTAVDSVTAEGQTTSRVIVNPEAAPNEILEGKPLDQPGGTSGDATVVLGDAGDGPLAGSPDTEVGKATNTLTGDGDASTTEGLQTSDPEGVTETDTTGGSVVASTGSSSEGASRIATSPPDAGGEAEKTTGTSRRGRNNS